MTGRAPDGGTWKAVSARYWMSALTLLLGAGLGGLAVAAFCHVHGGEIRVLSASYPRELARVTFVAAGDVIPHQAVVQSAQAASARRRASQAETKPAPQQPGAPVAASGAAPPPSPEFAGGNHDGWDALFSEVADLFQSADFGFVNLETPVAPAHSHGSKPFLFDAPVALLEALKASGVKIVSFANNHVMDQGAAGFTETREHLRVAGLEFAGTGDTLQDSWKPVIVEKNGVRVGWLGMTRWLNGNRNPDKDDKPHVNFFPYPGQAGGAPGLDEPAVIEKVKAAKAGCDFLVISIHWGIEYAPAPKPDDIELAHKLIEAGASVLVGHHPHVLQPVETYLAQDGRSTVIFYSLGNFLSNQSRNYIDGLMPDRDGEPRESLIVRFAVVEKDYGPAGKRFELGSVGLWPTWQENNRNAIQRGREKLPDIHPILIDRAIGPVTAQVDALEKKGSELSASEKQEYVEACNRLKMLQHQRELILARTGDEFVIDPPKVDAGRK